MIYENLISLDECNQIQIEFESNPHSKDLQVFGSDITYSLSISDFYLHKFIDIVEDVYGSSMIPIRAYIRKTYKNQILYKHVDKTQYAMSIMINQSDKTDNPFLIYFDKTTPTTYLQNRGDGILFEGSRYYHERPPIESDWILGMYLGYRTANKTTFV